MAREPMPENIKKSRSLGVRITPDQYSWLQQEAQRIREQTGLPVTMSAIAGRLISEAIREQNG